MEDALGNVVAARPLCTGFPYQSRDARIRLFVGLCEVERRLAVFTRAGGWIEACRLGTQDPRREIQIVFGNCVMENRAPSARSCIEIQRYRRMCAVE